MKIKELHLKNFGKLNGRVISLAEGVNLIYGENEAGKSTVHTFLKSMLFGMERGRGRAALRDDFRSYEPWENPGYYAGMLRFTCGGRSFCLERHFDKNGKKASLFCEDDGEKLSLEHGDLEILLGGITREQYENTVSVGQMKAAADESLAAALKNYAANYYRAGDGDIDLEAALLYLKEKKRQLYRAEKQMREEKAEKREKVELEASYIWRELHRAEQESEAVQREVDSCRQKLRRLKDLREENERKLREQAFAGWRVHPGILVLMLAALSLPFLLLPRPWSFIVLIVVALAEGLWLWNRMKDGKKKALVLSPEEQQEENERRAQLAKWEGRLEKLREDILDKQTRYGNLQEQAEELDEAGEEEQELEKRRRALELAGETLLRVSRELEASLKEQMNEKISSVLCRITGGRYEKVWLDEGMQIFVYGQNRRISLEQVSRGCAEQVYFALRMAAAELLQEEELPVILDDTFAFYDEKRLENTLAWLAESGRQVLILTCQKREEELLEKLHLPFHKVTL